MLKTDLTPAQVALLPKIEDDPGRYSAILRRFESRSVREVHDSRLADIAFLDLKALEVAGFLERKRRSRFSGWRLTEAGRGWLHPEPTTTTEAIKSMQACPHAARN